MDKYYYSKELGFYIGVQVNQDDIELTEAQFNQYNGKKVTYENGVFSFDFDTEKQNKLNEVSEKFLQMFKSGTFISPTLGFEVDNRRYADKFDKDNVESLIVELSDMAPGTTVQFKAVDGFHELNLSQLETLKKEMIVDGLSKHQWKWVKENEINAIVVDENTTAEQAIELLEAIEI